jgi:arginase family enzyme
MKTSVLIFPFDLFGGAGTGQGATLLGDELREVLADNRRERAKTTATYTPHLRLKEWGFDTLDDLTGWRATARAAVRSVLRAGDRLIWLGGNHLSVLPVLEEIATLDGPSVVVQFDAHLDIHHFADCSPELSHGNFLLHAEGALPTLVNVGHRELLLPADHIAKTFRRTLGAVDLVADPAGSLAEGVAICASAERVYFDIDCDVLDPAYFPAVTTPIPFGLAPLQLLHAIQALWSPKVAGVFVSEFAPGRDQDDRSLALLVWLLERLLLKWYAS